jgi:thiol:disulfide interchange protein
MTVPAFLWLAASAGALSLLTPCVFPMVPITVSFFTSHSGADRRTALRNALVFGLGIVLTFTALGLALAIFIGATGVALFAANPWVNLALAALFVAFALNLFGAYEITIPSRWLTQLDAATRSRDGAGMVGALLMGLTFTLTSFTCTAPFVGTVLATAARGHWKGPVVGMLAYSTVFALPFFLLALVPQWISRLPKAGGWLNSVKVVMGFLELAAALKFLANVDLVWHWGIVTRTVVLACWVALAALTTWYLLGGLQLSHDSPINKVGAGRLLVASGSLATGIWLATGLTGRSLGSLEAFLPLDEPATMVATSTVAPATAAGFHTVDANMPWRVNDYAGALAQAKEEHKPVFIDFTGYTCTNCRWMEANMFSRPEIRAALGHFVLARLFTDGEGPVYEQQQRFQEERFHTVALPLYAIIATDGSTIATFSGLTHDAAEYLAFLRKGDSGT